MAERKWTDEQLSAIEERSKTLLVSAAAGSGKTATLTERIIRSLTDSENPINIESLLIVTFTKAAAAELRVKLTNALEAALLKNPGDKRLEHQIYMLPSARIRTIDSFCNDVLKSGCDRVGVPPSYRLADTAECELLANSMIDALISAVYNGDAPEVATPEEFDELSDCLTDSKRTEELAEKLRFVYERCQSDECGVDSLLPLIDGLGAKDFVSVERTRHGAYLMMITHEMLAHYNTAVTDMLAELSVGDEGERKYLDMVRSDLECVAKCLSAATYEEMGRALSEFEFVRRPTVKRAEQTSLMLSYTALREMLKNDVGYHLAFYRYTTDEWRDLLLGLDRLLRVLYRFERRFDELFFEEKKRRGTLSYADIERLCFDCLIKDGEPTDIALNLRRQIEAVYIDEYQDVNSLQNRIFEVISRPNNRFMVGDIKQSIYGFRSACPDIFANMKAAFSPIAESTGDEASIFMSRNFRCDEAIIDFVNSIFDKAFSLVGDSIGYRDGDRLVYAKVHPKEPEYKKTEICMLDKVSGGEDDEKLDTAPTVVAKKIAELLKTGRLDDGSPIRPSDVAIIMRSAKGKASGYAEALASLGIPSEISAAKDFFLSSEVLLALCLLNSIDNPRRDIYLAGLMCSPLFGFEADDLARIRGFEAETLYESLVGYVDANPEYVKGAQFLRSLDYYRTISEGVGVDTLLFNLYQETGLIGLAAKGGGEDNLMLLYDYARSYEAGAFKGLYNFISFINNIIDRDTSFDDNRDVAAEDAVKIVTCHSSKGLEYPVVFLVDAGAGFSAQELRQRLVYSPDFALSFRLRTPSGLALVDNPVHDLVCHHVKRKNYEENLRVLYVALTRAREQLYIVGVCPTVRREEYELRVELLREYLSPYALRSLGSYLEIMLVTADGFKLVSPNEFLGEACTLTAEKGDSHTQTDGFILPDAPPRDADVAETAAEYTERFTFSYPNKYLTALPEKLSVSGTSPEVLDGADDNVFGGFSESVTAPLDAFAPEHDGRGSASFVRDAFDCQKSGDVGERVPNSVDFIGDVDTPAPAITAFGDLTSSGSAIPTVDVESLGFEIPDEPSFGEDMDSADAPNSLHAPLLNGVFSPDSALLSDTSDRKIHLPHFMTGAATDESAKRGIATHYFLQFCDLDHLSERGTAAELDRLLSHGFLTARDGERVRRYEIDLFLRSQLFRDMRGAAELYRELRFNVPLPAELFTQNAERREALRGHDVLVQGVIDCIVVYPDGSIGLFDYKTDRLTREELADHSLAAKKLRDKHSLQLYYYSLAVKRIFGRAPSRVEVYSLPLGKTVSVLDGDTPPYAVK